MIERTIGLTHPDGRGYTLDDLMLMRAVMAWEPPLYIEAFGPPGTTPRPPLRDYLLAEGFNVEKVDTYLEDRALAAEDRERRYAALKAEQATWRYRARRWRIERRDRIRTAIEALTGQHECGD